MISCVKTHMVNNRLCITLDDGQSNSFYQVIIKGSFNLLKSINRWVHKDCFRFEHCNGFIDAENLILDSFDYELNCGGFDHD